MSTGEVNQPDRDFGRRLRERREELGLTQTDLGAIAGVHRVTVRAWEAGRPVEAKTQTSILRALGCSATIIYEDKPPARRPSLHRPGGDATIIHEDEPQRLTLRPLFTAATTRFLVKGILPLLRGDEAEEAPSVAQDYLELVDGADTVTHQERLAVLPASFPRLRDQLAVQAGQLRVIDLELSRVFGETYPYLVQSGGGHFGDGAETELRAGAARPVTVATAGTARESSRAVPIAGVAGTAADARGNITVHHIQPDSARHASVATEPVVSHVRIPTPTVVAGRFAVGKARSLARGLDAVTEADLPDAVRAGLVEYLMIRAQDQDSHLDEEARAIVASLENLRPSLWPRSGEVGDGGA